MAIVGIYILVTLLLGMLWNPGPGILGCGIFGFNLKPDLNEDARRNAMNKFKVLGIYNESRGRDSCGISIDDIVLKGAYVHKEFDDFIQYKLLPIPKSCMTVLGHTRAAANSKGGNTEENAHPFTIDNHLIGTHNGVIYNIEDLLKKYDLNPKDFNVDSKGLYTLIEKEGFDILNEYIGHAALAFKYLDDPGTLYLYHGASKTTKASKLWEERPLYIMETSEGIFYSSIENALKAIRETEEETPACLNYNTVFQIRNGEFTGSQWTIDREENNISAPSTTSGGNVSKTPFKANSTGTNTSKNTGLGTRNKRSTSGVGAAGETESAIFRETLPSKVVNNKGDFIYYHQGRYWEHPRRLCFGKYKIYKRGMICNDESISTEIPEIYYFFQGVMLKDEKSYDVLVEIEKTSTSFIHNQSMNFAACINEYAKWPVANMPGQSTKLEPFFKNAWYSDGRRFEGNFTPKFSGRTYFCVNGFLTEIKSAQKEETLFKDLKTSELEIQLFEKGGLLAVPGGTVDETTFPTGAFCSIPGASQCLHPLASKFDGSEDNSNDESIDENTDSDEVQYFYEVKFKSFEEALKNIGTPEIKALRRYVKAWLERDNRVEADEREIEMGVCDIITMSTGDKMAIIDFCDTEEERYILRNAYQEELQKLKENNELIASKLADSYSPSDYENEVNSVFENKIEEEELDMSTAEDVREVLTSNIESAEASFAEASRLFDDQDSDLAQETAAALFKSVSAITGNLQKVADKYNYKDLSARLEKLTKRDPALS